MARDQVEKYAQVIFDRDVLTKPTYQETILKCKCKHILNLVEIMNYLKTDFILAFNYSDCSTNRCTQKIRKEGKDDKKLHERRESFSWHFGGNKTGVQGNKNNKLLYSSS